MEYGIIRMRTQTSERLRSMPTQDERLTTLEQQFTAFQKEAGAHIRETEENTTILLGVIRSQGRDIKRIVERLDIMDQRIEQLGTTLHEHTALLTQILERLPKQQS